jgi:hypothetical protein
LKPWRSAQRWYMRCSISAQSWLSTPPAPALTETMALALSKRPPSMRRNSILPTRSRGREGVGGLEDAVGVLGLTPELVEGLGVVEALLGVIEVVDDLLGGGLIAEDLLGLVVVGPERRVGGLGVELLEALALADVVKDAAATRPIGPRGERAAR